MIAEVIATRSAVFQNEANLNLSYLRKIFPFTLWGWVEEPEGGDSDEMATPSPNQGKGIQSWVCVGVEGGAPGSPCRWMRRGGAASVPQGQTPAP